MNASPMATHYQHACKHFTLSVQLYCSTAHKIFLPIFTDVVCKENLTKAST